MLISLRTLSNVLNGKDAVGQNEPLIKLFADRWFNKYQPTKLREDVPLSAYYRPLDQWLHEMSIIQYMGLSAFANARIANGNFETLEHEILDVARDMEEQQQWLARQVPEWTRTLPEEVLKPDSWFVIRAFGLEGRGPTNDSLVMYGPPQSDLSSWVRFRDWHPWNWDEEWNFEKVDTNKSATDHDVFTLVVRNWNAVLRSRKTRSENGPQVEQPQPSQASPGYGRSLDPKVPDVPRADAYIPVLGFVSKAEYVVSKLMSGTTIAGDGAMDKAIRFRIVQP